MACPVCYSLRFVGLGRCPNQPDDPVRKTLSPNTNDYNFIISLKNLPSRHCGSTLSMLGRNGSGPLARRGGRGGRGAPLVRLLGEKDVEGAVFHVYVELGDNLEGGVHRQDRDADVYDIHVQISDELRYCSAAANVDLA